LALYDLQLFRKREEADAAGLIYCGTTDPHEFCEVAYGFFPSLCVAQQFFGKSSDQTPVEHTTRIYA